jgi:DHA2 family multidrug resistance protein
MLPSSIATAVTMLFVGRLSRKRGPRPVFLVGVSLFMIGAWGMTRWTLESSFADLFWPQVARGIGLGAMFVPLSVATLGGLPLDAVPQGAGLYSLFRQLGGSAGIALLATLLDHRGAVHRAQLTEHMSLLDAQTWTRVTTLTAVLARRGFDAASAHLAALELMAKSLKAQAAMLAFSDCYRFVFALFILCAPLGLLLRKPPLRRPIG